MHVGIVASLLALSAHLILPLVYTCRTYRSLLLNEPASCCANRVSCEPDSFGRAPPGIQTDEIKQTLIQVTQAAVDRGIFGVPTTFVAGEMHFGQDRLEWVERALAA